MSWLGGGCGVSAALSLSWGSHSSLEPGQPFVPLQQWQWVLRGDFWPRVLIMAILWAMG